MALSHGNGAGFILVREALFTEHLADPAVLDAPPSALTGNGFLDEDLRRAELFRPGFAAARIPISDSTASAIDRARALVLGFSVGGGATCGTFTGSLVEQALWLRSAQGCCSDHTEVFLALAPLARLSAREVRNADHTVVEIFDPRSREWVMVDPMGALLARDSSGRALSMHDLRRSLLARATVRWEMFGAGWRHPRDTTSAWFRTTYGVGSERDRIWSELMWTWGNNVYLQAAGRRSASRFGKAVEQLRGYASRERPGYRVIPEADPGAALHLLVRYAVATDLLLSLALGCGLVWGLRRSPRVLARPTFAS